MVWRTAILLMMVPVLAQASSIGGAFSDPAFGGGLGGAALYIQPVDAALWTPADLDEPLALWLDADDASTITLNGATVSQWDDKSGNAHHATQATASNQPIYTTNGLNGRPVLSFDGVDDELITAPLALGETAAMVAQRSSIDQPVIEAPIASNRGFWGSYSGFTTHLNYAVSGGPLLSAPPNSAVTTPSLVSQTGLLQTSTFAYKIGSATPGYLNLNGFIAEVVVTDTLLSTFDRQKLEGYLAWKWGVEADLPADHPYKSAPPTTGEPAYDPDAAAYIAAVEAADGQALEDGVKIAINDFIVGCKTDGTWDAIKSSAILAGARTLNGALVPLVGTAPTNFNFVSGDYNRKTGLAGDGLTKYLDSNRANNADPQNDKHASVYVTTPGADGPPIGSNNFGITGSTVVQYDQSFPRFITRVNAGGGGGVTSTASTASFIGVSRDNASSHIFRFNNTFATISYASQTPSSSNVKVFYDGTTFYSGAVKFYSIGESIDLALLDARVSALMTDIDAAFDSLYALAGAVPTLDLKLAENGDFTDAISGDNLVTFSRSAASSPGTYVGSDGLIKTAAFNNILYSEQFNTGWTLSGVTVLPDAAVSPDGETTADKLVATTVFGVSSNRIYRSASGNTLSIYAKKAEADEILIRSGDGSDSAKHVIFSLNDGSVTSVSGTGHSAYGSEDAGNGWFRLWVNSNTTYIFAYFAVAGASCANGNGIYIWGAQLEEGGAVNPYIPTTSQALAAARFDHDPLTGESLGLLVEEQRTNLWTYSGDPDSLSWGLFGVTRRTTSPIAAPDGTSISTVFDFSAAPGRAIEKSIAVSGNNTVSAYLRTESGTETMYFTLNNGSNIYSQPFTVTDEWQRFSFTLDTTGGTGVVAIRNGAAGGAKSVYAWGVQYEAGASPTSYIPTTSAAMTRAADIATIEGADFASWYNSTDGTGYGEFDRENPGSSLVQVLFHFAGPVGRFALYEHVPALAASGFYNLGVSACPVGTFCKHSGAFSGGGSGTESSAFDGVVVVGEAGTVNPDVNKLYIGSRPTGQQLNGHIKRLTYWNTRLPDANLGAITS